MRRYEGVKALIAIILLCATGTGWCDDDPSCPPISGGLLQLVAGEKPIYPLGAQVVLQFVIQNQSNKPIIYRFTNAKQFDMWVTRGGAEVFRASRGRMYAQGMTTFTLKPCESKTFCATWDQKDYKCKQVGPGAYKITAQLDPTVGAPPSVSGWVQIGGAGVSVLPVTVKQAVSMFDQISKWTVSVSGVYRGWRASASDPNIKPGPPVSRSDWTICDSTGCMYVNGHSNLDPDRDVGKSITATGALHRTASGQVYMISKSVTVNK